ncbi:MAG: winged helix-turn-helix domain-containing protein [Treponema sp.]|nr:winged helix-turn-helix domain-containing protein [Treponema sp.]
MQAHINQNDTVNDTVNSILQLLKENPLISYDDIAKKLGKSRPTVSRKIAELKKQGVIERAGSAKKGSWRIVPKAK